MARTAKNTKTVSKKSTKVTAKKTTTAKVVRNTSGRMPAWVAKLPRFAKDYVLEMRSKGKPYDAKGYKTWRSEVIAKEKAAKIKAKTKVEKLAVRKAAKSTNATPVAKTKAKVTAKKK